MSTVCQNSWIPLINSCFVCGLISRRRYSFNSCHKFSIGFMSGDSGGDFHQLIPFSSKNSEAKREVCFGSLSWKNRCESGYTLAINGFNVLFKISVYITASIFPSNIHRPVLPRKLMPPHTCTLTGCFALREQEQGAFYVCYSIHWMYIYALHCIMYSLHFT